MKSGRASDSKMDRTELGYETRLAAWRARRRIEPFIASHFRFKKIVILRSRASRARSGGPNFKTKIGWPGPRCIARPGHDGLVVGGSSRGANPLRNAFAVHPLP